MTFALICTAANGYHDERSRPGQRRARSPACAADRSQPARCRPIQRTTVVGALAGSRVYGRHCRRPEPEHRTRAVAAPALPRLPPSAGDRSGRAGNPARRRPPAPNDRRQGRPAGRIGQLSIVRNAGELVDGLVWLEAHRTTAREPLRHEASAVLNLRLVRLRERASRWWT